MEWYSSIVLDHVTSPRNVGSLADANAVGRAGVQGQGNYLVLYLKIEGEEIKRASFQTYGCPAAIASGSLMTSWLKGKTIEEAKNFTAEELKSALGGLPLGKEHCPRLAISALQDALRNYHD